MPLLLIYVEPGKDGVKQTQCACSDSVSAIGGGKEPWHVTHCGNHGASAVD